MTTLFAIRGHYSTDARTKEEARTAILSSMVEPYKREVETILGTILSSEITKTELSEEGSSYGFGEDCQHPFDVHFTLHGMLDMDAEEAAALLRSKWNVVCDALLVDVSIVLHPGTDQEETIQ